MWRHTVLDLINVMIEASKITWGWYLGMWKQLGYAFLDVINMVGNLPW